MHQTMRNLLLMCECFAAEYLQSTLVANLWIYNETELHVYYQFNRMHTGEQYHSGVVYTDFHNLSNRIYADVKQMFKHFHVTSAPKCEK